MRDRVWQKAAKDYLLPALSGNWKVVPGRVVRVPIGRLAHFVLWAAPGYKWKAWARIWPLHVPQDHLSGIEAMIYSLNREAGMDLFPSFDAADEGRVSMEALAGLIENHAVPYFEQHGNLEGYAELCRKTNEGEPNGGFPDVLRKLAGTELLLGNVDAAIEALGWIEWQLGEDRDLTDGLVADRDEARVLARRILDDPDGARDYLLEVERRQRVHFRLPPLEE